jgi:hypothetical protein
LYLSWECVRKPKPERLNKLQETQKSTKPLELGFVPCVPFAA